MSSRENKKMILPFLFVFLVGASTADHTPSCRLCLNTCSSTASYATSLCKCDADCQVFGDCCGDHTPPSSCPASQLPRLPDGVKLDCISTYFNPAITVQADNIAFLVVSTCPDSWMETEGGITAKTCTNPDSATTLPLVTSTATGMVYRNEYCAHCNGVRTLVAWQTDLVCNPTVYQALSTKNLTEILKSDPDFFQRECQACAFQIPSIMTSRTTAPRSCIPRVSSCLRRKQLELLTERLLQDETYALMEEKCELGVLDLVVGTLSRVVYHNPDCAACNAETVTECYRLSKINQFPELCFPGAELTTTAPTGVTNGRPGPGGLPGPNGLPYPDDRIPPPPPLPLVLPFTITLSNLGGGAVSISTISDQTSISLDCPEGTAPVGLECRPTQCPEGYSEMGGSCSYNFPPLSIYPGSNITRENCSTGFLLLNETDYTDLGNGTVVLAEDKSMVAVIDYDEFGRPLICIGNMSLDCPTPLVPLNESDYIRQGNDSIIYENRTIEVLFYDRLGRPLVCPYNNTTIIITVITIQLLATLPGLQELTYIGCSLSILGAISILLTYSIFSEFRTLPGVVLMNLCSTVLATNLVFIAGAPVIQSYPVKALCSSLAIVLHFSYLAQFTWMSIFSFEMVRNFHQAKKLVMDSSKTKRQLFAIYMCIGWCLPVLIITISITLNFSTQGLILYGVDKDKNTAGCWINHFESFVITFLSPLILSLSCNIIMFAITTHLLCQFSRNQSKLQKSNSFALIRVWLATFSTTGLTWVFGFLAISNQVSWMWYPFVIFNSTQGLTMFLAFLFSKKILKLYLSLFSGKRLKKYTLSSTKNKTMVVNHSKIAIKKCTTSMSTLSCGQVLGETRVGVAQNRGGMSNGCGVEDRVNAEA